MRKAQFNYKKEDETISTREILNPIFVKESSNKLKDFEKLDVKYLEGYQINKEGLTEAEEKQYMEALEEYVDWTRPTVADFFSEQGLDPKRVEFKNFKKSGISELQIFGD